MISIIVPAYNNEKAIVECLESLSKSNQSYKKPYEIIVVDDGSHDNTANEARRLGARVIRQRNSGPARARNAGARAAKGSLLLFTDADCVTGSDWIIQMVKPFSNKKIVGVQGRYKTKQKGIVPIFTQMEIEQRYERIKKAKNIDFIGSYSAAYRKGVFLKFGGFDESFPAASGEDPELSFRMAKAGHRMIFNPGAVVYHTHSTSLSKYLRSRYVRGYWGRLLYKKHPDKRNEGSDKGPAYFLSIGLTCMLTLLLFLSYVAETLLSIQYFVSIITFILLISVVLYESLYFISRNKTLARAAPVVVIIVLFRNIAIGTGIAVGMIKLR